MWGYELKSECIHVVRLQVWDSQNSTITTNTERSGKLVEILVSLKIRRWAHREGQWVAFSLLFTVEFLSCLSCTHYTRAKPLLVYYYFSPYAQLN